MRVSTESKTSVATALSAMKGTYAAFLVMLFNI